MEESRNHHNLKYQQQQYSIALYRKGKTREHEPNWNRVELQFENRVIVDFVLSYYNQNITKTNRMLNGFVDIIV